MTEKKITKDMTLGDVLSKYPEAAPVMLEKGLHCIGCHIAPSETVEQGCKGHGMSDEEVNKMVEEMNKVIEEANKPKELEESTEEDSQDVEEEEEEVKQEGSEEKAPEEEPQVEVVKDEESGEKKPWWKKLMFWKKD